MKKLIAVILCFILALVFAGCSKVDSDYGVSSSSDVIEDEEKTNSQVQSYPAIMSDDEVMPKFFDISLYDEENYANIYLGKDFEYDITYSGMKMKLPSSYDEMLKLGWSLVESKDYNSNVSILAGKYLRANFQNADGRQIIVVFYNPQKTSKKMKKCNIVKFIVPENKSNTLSEEYGSFLVNGVNNDSAITDVIEQLGNPSHFYAVSESKYYFDYFLTPQDRRSGITVYVDIENDCIDSIEISYY